MPVNTTITVRKGSSSEWNSTNPVLASGEPGYDITNNILKIGDGVKTWTQLSNHNHTTNNITDFNSSVSGLLPVKNVLGSGYVNVSSSSGNYTVSVSGLQPSGNYANSVHSHGNITSSGTIGSSAGRMLITTNSGIISTEDPTYIIGQRLTNGTFGSIGLHEDNGSPTMRITFEGLTFPDNTYQDTAFNGNDVPFAYNAYSLYSTADGDTVLTLNDGEVYIDPNYIDPLRAAIQASPLTHSHGNISSAGRIGSTSGLLVTTGASGILTTSSGVTSSYITDFNSSVSGLLPVKNILAGPNISISSTSGTYSIGVSGSLGLTTEEVDDRIASLLVAGTGINISYDDINNSLILSSENYYGANRGIINVTSSTSSFNVPGGYTVGSFDLFLNGVKLIDNVDFTATNGYSFTAASPIPSGSTLEFISLTLANPLHIASDQYSAGISRDIINVTGTLSTINIVGGYDVGGLDLYKDGLKLIKNIQYTANNGSSITLNTPASSGSVIEYVSFIAGKARRSLNKISSNTIAGSVPQTDYIYVASSPLTVTLPSASGNNNRYTIKNMSNSIVSVVPFTGQTIDQQTIIAISTKYNSVDVVSDGENWILI